MVKRRMKRPSRAAPKLRREAPLRAPARGKNADKRPVAARRTPPKVNGASVNITAGPLQAIGVQLRHARIARELRMKDVAAAAGCSESLISKLEKNKVIPSLNVLHRICDALGLTIGEIFAAPGEENEVVTRAGARRIVEVDSLRKGTGIRMERLVPYAKGHLLQGNIHVVAPGGSTDGELSHDGEEVGYVISGKIELTLGDRTFRLSAGDSFSYRSELAHGYRNPGRNEARVLFVNTPPTF
jgi:transcriptional regulator with XRE-family HTH domain